MREDTISAGNTLTTKSWAGRCAAGRGDRCRSAIIGPLAQTQSPPKTRTGQFAGRSRGNTGMGGGSNAIGRSARPSRSGTRRRMARRSAIAASFLKATRRAAYPDPGGLPLRPAGYPQQPQEPAEDWRAVGSYRCRKPPPKRRTPLSFTSRKRSCRTPCTCSWSRTVRRASPPSPSCCRRRSP
jgi:hypothetical protein